jgi:hypothetical protein
MSAPAPEEAPADCPKTVTFDGFPTKRRDVVVNPAQRGDLIEQSVIT